MVHSSTQETHGLPRQTRHSVEVFPAARNPVSKAHNWQEMAVFAQGIEPHILTDG
jgi:hypothetical protein